MKKNAKMILAVISAACIALTACSKDTADTSASETAETATSETASAVEYDLGLDDDGYFRYVTASKYIKMPKDYKKYTVSKDVYAVTDEEIQSELDYFQSNYKLTTEVTDRAAQEGDVVNIDYEGTVDGVAFTGGTTDDEDDGTCENFPHQKASHDEDDNESMDAMDASEDKEKRRFSIWTVLLVVICIVLIAMIGYIGWKAYDYYHIPAYETGNISDDVEEPVSTPSILIPSSNSSESDSEPEPTPKPAYSKNTIGYLTVPGVDVTDEPILQHPTDDDYYLTHNEFDRESIWGAYFVPSEWNVSNVDDMYRVTVIFGHSNGNSMHKKFSVLKYFRDVNFAKEHRYIYLTLGEQQTRWKIFAVADYPIDPSYTIANPDDSYFLTEIASMKAYLPMLLAEAKRNHIMVIAAGIGACRQSIHSEFPENFLDISDMNSMPRNICNIIKRKLVK